MGDTDTGPGDGNQRFRFLLERLPDVVAYVYDRAHRVTGALGAGLSRRGLTAAAVIGSTPDDQVGASDAKKLHELIDRAFSGEVVCEEVLFESTGRTNLLDIVHLGDLDGGDAADEVLVVTRDISSMKARQIAVATAEARWRAAFEMAPSGVVEIDPEGKVLVANQAMADLLGVRIGDLVGSTFREFLRADFRPSSRSPTFAAALGALAHESAEACLVTGAGVERWVDVRGAVIPDPDGGSTRLLLHVNDTSAARTYRKQLEAAKARYEALVAHSSDGILVTSAEGTVSYASPGFVLLTGRTATELIGSDLSSWLRPEDGLHLIDIIDRLVSAEGSVVTFDCRLVTTSGSGRYLEVTAANHMHDRAIDGIVMNARDVTDRVEAANRLVHQALHDSLTQLPNRALLLDRLELAIARSRRSDRPCAVLFLDLDRFKEINDTFGHAMGDQLLIAVADRLVHAARPSDSIARLGGDEFVVVLEEIAGRDAATALAERLRHSIGGPMLIGDRSVTVSCSVGIALWDGHDATTLLQEADTALYHAKQSGRDRWELYDEAMRRQAWRRFEMEEHLRSALQADGVEVHFQPIVELETRRHIAHEALARLRAHDGTVIYPHEFIDVAEESDLIVALGATVLEKACHTYAMRSRGDPALERITVNVSARQLAAAAFIDHVIVALTTAGISPSALCLELTESVLIDAGGGVDARLHGLKALGVRIALDDFGTGWSSLAYLRRFPIDVVKIDRSFVTGLGTNDDDMELVRAVIGLGHALGHVTVAEGIETELQHEILCSLGCRYGQGFLYGRPMPA